MRKLIRIAVLLALAAMVSAVIPAGARPPGTDGYNEAQDGEAGECQGGAGNTMTYVGALKLWPPNHKYNTTPAVTTSGQAGETIRLTTTGTHDQYEGDTEVNGSGNTGDDITINDDEADITSDENDTQVVALETGLTSVTTGWKARAERSGTIQEGRNYTITARAEFGDGGVCTGSWTLHVPHDMRPSRR